MKKIGIFGLLLSVTSAFSQITITSGDFPDGGDTALVSISTDFDLDYEAAGEDFVWDYSSLEMTDQRIDTFFKIDDASITYQLIFNNGWFDPDYQANFYQNAFNFAIPATDLIGVSIEKPVTFTKIESDRVELVGVGLEIEGIQVPIKNEIIDVEYELPLNFGDDWISNSFFEIDLNPAYDGILRRYQERSSQVDGWGEIITPFGTFDVIRTISFLDFTDSLRISFGGDPTWIEIPTPSQVVYTWWAEDQKIPVLQVVAQTIFGTTTVTSVEYKDRYLLDLEVEETQAENIQIYPNPTNDFVTIQTQEKPSSLEIYSMTGQLVFTPVITDQSNSIDLRNLSPGTYLLRIVLNGEVYNQQLVIN
jgi:hypothetical protein